MFWNNEETGSGRLADGYAGRLSGKTENAFFAFAAEGAFFWRLKFQMPQAKWIGVPTTAGTGSEVTCWATIWDPSKDAKRSLESQQNYAFAAVADPDLIRQMRMETAQEHIRDFFVQMQKLGFTDEETLEMIRQTLKGETHETDS